MSLRIKSIRSYCINSLKFVDFSIANLSNLLSNPLVDAQSTKYRKSHSVKAQAISSQLCLALSS